MVLKKSYAFHAVTATAMVASLVLALRTPWNDPRAGTYAGLFALSSIFLGLSISIHWATLGARVARLRFDDVGIWLNEVLVARRHYSPDGDLTYEALVADDPDAASIISAVSLPLRRTRFTGAAPIRPGVLHAIALGLIALAGLSIIALPGKSLAVAIASPSLLLAACVGAFSQVRSSIDVGADGILRTWLRYRQFIPLRAIREAKVAGGDEIAVHLESGERVRVIFARNAHDIAGVERRNRDAALMRLNRSLEANRNVSSPTWLIAHLGCRGRDRAQWVRDLADAHATASDYRASALRDEDLWRILEDPLAPEDARAGAAIALRRSDDPRAAARLRVAAEAIASPRLRVTLEASAREDVTDAMLADLLAAFEDKAPSSRTKS